MAKDRRLGSNAAVKWGRNGWLPPAPPVWTPRIERVAPWVWMLVILAGMSWAWWHA